MPCNGDCNQGRECIFRKPKEYTKEEIAQWKWSNEGEIREKTK